MCAYQTCHRRFQQWRQQGVVRYEPGSWGPREADRFVADIGGWNIPE